MDIDGNLYALRQHEKEQEQQECYQEATEEKAGEIQSTLLDNEEFTSYNNIKYDIADFYADFEVENDTLTEFLKENSIYGSGQYLRKKMTEALEKYCNDLAVEEIDNIEQDEPF